MNPRRRHTMRVEWRDEWTLSDLTPQLPYVVHAAMLSTCAWETSGGFRASSS